jgi:hypothetical protein
MFEYTYKYQDYLRNKKPSFGPFYTSFVVAVEKEIEKMAIFESFYYPTHETGEIGIE